MKPIIPIILALLLLCGGCATDQTACSELQKQNAALSQIYFNSDWTDAHRSQVDATQLYGTDPAGCDAYVEKYAGSETILPFIDNWDQATNHGASPQYVLALPAP